MAKLSKNTQEGLRVLAANNGGTILGRQNSVREATIHHNSLKALVAEGLAKDTETARGVRKIALTAAGRKMAKAL
jgi:hypothetical protein